VAGEAERVEQRHRANEEAGVGDGEESRPQDSRF
jgi:hypothetical protein